MNECIICFDNINNNEKIVQCNNCKNYFHKKCYERWDNIKKDNKCVYCMSNNTVLNMKINRNKKPDCFLCCNIL